MHNKKMGEICSAEGTTDRKAPTLNVVVMEIFVLIFELLTQFMTLTTQHA